MKKGLLAASCLALLILIGLSSLLAGSCIIPAASQQTQQVKSMGPQRVIVILVEFPDFKHSSSRDSINDLIFVHMDAYYREASYNLTWIIGETTRDWILLPSPFRMYGDMGFRATWSQRRGLVEDAIRAADKEVDFRKFDQAIIVVPNVPLVGYASDRWGIRTDDGAIVNRATVQREDRPLGVFAHEMGHSLGLLDMYDHALALKLGSSDAAAIYVGAWDLMSTAFRGSIHFSSYNKIKLGWIPMERVSAIPRGGIATVLIDPLELPSGGIHALRIPIASQRYYLIEARRRIGFDKYLPDEGILIFLIDESIRGDGFARVIDANPSTDTLDDATFDARPGKNSTFSDPESGIAAIVLHGVGPSFKVHITTHGRGPAAIDAWRAILRANDTISRAKEAGRAAGLEMAEAELARALSAFDGGRYEEARELALGAGRLAEEAKPPAIKATATATEAAAPPAAQEDRTPLYLGALALIAIVAVLMLIYRSRRKGGTTMKATTYPETLKVTEPNALKKGF